MGDVWRAIILCVTLFLNFCKEARPADILIPSWSTSDKPAAIDVSITSPLKSSMLSEAGVVAGLAARQTEERKHIHVCSNLICAELCSTSGGDIWCMGNHSRPIFLHN